LVKALLEELVASMTKVYTPLSIYPTIEVPEDAREIVIQATMQPLLERIKQEVKEEVQPKEEKLSNFEKVQELRKSKQLEINLELTDDERYMQMLGISKVTYDAMVTDGAGVLAFEFAADGHIFVLDFMKALQVAYKTKMSELYKTMRHHGIIDQDMKADNWKYNIYMSQSSMKSGYGYTQPDAEKGHNYPRFTRKGITAVLFMLAQEGLIPQTVIAFS
jgi:hypothetical protein